MPSGGQAERGRDLERLLTFVDAVAAVAITLLVLPLVDLAGELHSTNDSVGDLITSHWGRFWAFALSFLVIARLWLAQHELMRPVIAQNRFLVVGLVMWSLAIVFLPFPTALLPLGGDQVITKILYIGTLAIASTFLTLLGVVVGRDSSIRETDHGPAVAPSAVTAVLFAAALGISLAVPASGYFPLALLVVTDLAVKAVRRIRRGVAAPKQTQ
ncbi:MAG TPA: TMEM175 family protein [Jatrophihabitans sp.]|jgi:uncharacterized membrane protein